MPRELLERVDRAWHAACAAGSPAGKSDFVAEVVRLGLECVEELETGPGAPPDAS